MCGNYLSAVFFFFKQKTAYEMRISDWSSEVCSSDLSGISNKEKAHTRELYAEGKASREELLDSEIGAYHTKGTCTFYGTANTNQMMMEAMGLHIPGAAFVNPGTK